MTYDALAQALHLRKTLGGVLSPEEQARLQQWHTQLDVEEDAMLTKSRKPDDAAALQVKIDETLAQIVIEAQTIQALETTNASIRDEITELKRQLVQKKSPQSV